MGEYTKSLQLYKADVVENANDTFNIETMLNDNWDKIDEKLEKLPIQNGGLYINSETTEEDKAEAVEAIKEIGLSASDVGALPSDEAEARKALEKVGYGIKSYIGLPPIGLEVGTETIESIVEAMPTWSEIIATVGSQCNISIYPSTYGTLRVTKCSDNSRVIFEFVKKSSNQRWLGVYDGSVSQSWSGWIETANPSGYLTLDGSRAMNGTIDFAAKGADYNTDSWFAIGMDNESISLLSRKNGKNRRLNLNNITSSLTDALRLWYYDDGNEHTARIFGEHNTSLLAATIQNLISGGSISMVKSVQRGIITIAASSNVGTATISSVNTSKAVVLFVGSICGSDKSTNPIGWDARLVLKSATQVEATRAYSSSYTASVSYQVLEFY